MILTYLSTALWGVVEGTFIQLKRRTFSGKEKIQHGFENCFSWNNDRMFLLTWYKLKNNDFYNEIIQTLW